MSDKYPADIIVSESTGVTWEVVVGLEVHCELATNTKLFCGCPNVFGSEPNTNICPVCLGLPGSLPVVNEQVVQYSMKLGRALHCTVQASIFARKNYFYPDMPKDYQVTQFDQPTNIDGYLVLPDGLQLGIERAHIEEDTGKNSHMGGSSGRIHDAGYSLIDYNRAGVPLVEIVGRPDIRSAEQAKAYVEELRAILLATGVSDAKMEEGSMRVDANVSVRELGSSTLGTRCEIKNVNSLRSLGRAISYESQRHVQLIESGEKIKQETRHWDEQKSLTRSGRSKEGAEDYRYFQEPDLLPLVPTKQEIDDIDAQLGILPAQRRTILAELAGVSTESVALHVQRGMDSLAIDAIELGGDPIRVLNHIEHNIPLEDSNALTAGQLCEVTQLEVAGTITATQAKQVLLEAAETGKTPTEIAKAHGFEAMDTDFLDAIVSEILTNNSAEWEQFCTGDEKARGKLTGFFVGQIMRSSKGKADGKMVTALLHKKASEHQGS